MTRPIFPGEEAAETLVQVARYRNPTEAQLARGMLESAGIECFLGGENANALVPSAFRVALKVRREDEDAARAMLDEVEEDADA